MQIKSPIFFIILSISLASCTNDRLPEEKFEIPGDKYPRLIDVPDRPSYPSDKEMATTQKQLESARDSAHEAVKSYAPQ